MNKFLFTLLVFGAFQLQNSSSQKPETWFIIDCGLETLHIGWRMDDPFTQSGVNKLLSGKQALDEMNTLRFFPNRMDQNCYTIPAYKETRQYIIRAGFYYGNYDGLANPPTFDLYIDGGKWSTVNTSTTGGPVYVEAIYVTHGMGTISVCLVQTSEGETPFISSLEFMPLWTHLYSQMENNATFTLLTRTNFGGNEVRYTWPFSDEKYNRIWTSGVTPPNCKNVSTLLDPSTDTLENDPPISVIKDSIVSNTTSDPIIITVHHSEGTPQSAYLVFYFTDPARGPTLNDTRIIDIYINGQMMYTVGTEVDKCKVVTLYPVPVLGPTIDITLAPSRLSTMPPMISAMEVFTRPDLSSAHGTNSTRGTWQHFFAHYVILVHIFCILFLSI